LKLKTEDGLTLEAMVDEPPGAPRGGVVLCHPHPQMGGSMRAPFLDEVARVLSSAGLRVLRFNTRGTGASEGSYAGGLDEAKDLAAAWDAVAAEPRGLAGWSFGARLVMVHAGDSAAPAALFAPVLRSESGIRAPLVKPAGPTLVVVGDRDRFVAAEELETYFGSPPLVLEGCDHFFIGRFATKAATAASDFFLEHLSS
jgi:alpha/beta superfamily hydrolase